MRRQRDQLQARLTLLQDAAVRQHQRHHRRKGQDWPGAAAAWPGARIMGFC